MGRKDWDGEERLGLGGRIGTEREKWDGEGRFEWEGLGRGDWDGEGR